MTAPTFRDFALLALDLRAEQGIRGLDSERNRFMNHIACAAFAKKPIGEVRPIDLRDWLRSMQSKKAADTRGDRFLTDETTKRAFALVSSIFTCAVERELIERSPCGDVRLKKRATEDATREKWTYLTLDEQKAIAACEAIPTCDRLAIRFAIATGLRQGEMFSLMLKDLHTGPDSPHVFVRFGKPNLPPKSGKTRRVPLFGDGLVAARRWTLELSEFAPNNPHAIVFPTPRGGRRSVGKPLGGGGKLRKYLALVGITRRVRWHDLRHTFCSNLVTGALGQTWPLLHVKEMAGHSSVTITERYAHVGQRDLVSLANASSFSHEPMPLVSAAPADDFYAFDWKEAESA